MSRRFDLQSTEGESGQASGITALDLADLPPPLPKMLRLMLRQGEMTYPDIQDAVGLFPETDQLTSAELDEALDSLTRHGWLTHLSDRQPAVYRVNLRRKITNTSSDFQPRRRSSGALAQGIWSALENESSSDTPAKRHDKPDPPSSET